MHATNEILFKLTTADKLCQALKNTYYTPTACYTKQGIKIHELIKIQVTKNITASIILL